MALNFPVFSATNSSDNWSGQLRDALLGMSGSGSGSGSTADRSVMETAQQMVSAFRSAASQRARKRARDNAFARMRSPELRLRRNLDTRLHRAPVTSSKRRKKKRRKVTRRQRTKYRKFKRKVLRIARKNDIWGRILIKRDMTNRVIKSDDNKCHYYSFITADRTDLGNLMNDDYIQLGMNDALTAQREEVLNLLDGFHNFKLYYKIKSRLEIKNNYNYAVKLSAWWCTPRDKTGTGPVTLIASGLDRVSRPSTLPSPGWEYNPCFYPEMSRDFRRGYRTLRRKDYVINPGENLELWFGHKWKMYPMADYNKYIELYQPWHTMMLVLRLQGTPATDTVTDPLNPGVGYSSTALDTIQTDFYKFRHVGQNQVVRHQSILDLAPAPAQAVIPDAVGDYNTE